MNRPVSTQIDSDNPWPGLASFTEENSGFFFGREKETTELVRLIRRNVLTVLFGQSGLGKSSLLQAGAFPALRAADYFPLYVRLDHDPAAPALADQVKAALGAAFAAEGVDATAPQANESLWEYFHRKDVDHWSAKNRLLTPVLAFDQFEEIFTLGNADETRRARAGVFLTELADLVQHRVPAALRERFESGELNIEHFHFDKASCHIVLSLREDFLPNLEGLKQEMRSVMRGRMRVQRLNGLQALDIVQRPAPQLLAEGVAERIVEFVAGARGGSADRLAEFEVEPALLSVICRELNERRRKLGQKQITADLVTGNRREILTDFYERSVADLPPDMRTFVEDHLLTKSGFRDNLALETALEFPGVTRPLIDTLVSRRLLRLEDRLGVQRVELTHDVLAEVIRGSRDTRQQRLAIEKERQREILTRRRMWLARTIAAGLLVACAGVSWIAWRAIHAEREQARLRDRSEALRVKAERQELAAQRMAYASDMNGVQHALAANNLGRARELLYRHRPAAGEMDLRGWEWRFLWQLCQSQAKAVVRGPRDNSVYSIATSPDGKWVAAGGLFSGYLTLTNLATKDEVQVPAGRGKVNVAFAPGGALLAIGTEAAGGILPGAYYAGAPDLGGNKVQLWDLQARRVVREIPLGGSCCGIAFSSDGRSLAVADFGRSSAITIWNVSDGARLASWPAGVARSAITSLFSATPDLTLAASPVNNQGGGEVAVIDLKTGAKRISVKAIPSALALSADGKILAYTGGRFFSEPIIYLHDVAADRELGQLPGHRGRVGELVFSPDGTRLVSVSADQTIAVWDLATRSRLRSFQGHETEVWRVAFVGGQRTVVSGCKDGSIYLWDLEAEFNASATAQFEARTLAWGFAGSANAIITLGGPGLVRKRTAPRFEVEPALLELGPVTGIPVVDSKHPLVAAVTAGNRIQVWNWQSRALVRELPSPGDFRPEVFSGNGTKLILRSYSRSDVFSFQEWDFGGGAQTRAFEFPLIPTERPSHAYSADGSKFVSFAYPGGKGQLFDLQRGIEIPLACSVFEPARQPDFSADGRLLAVPSLRSNLQLYDLETNRNVATLRGYMFGVHSATFSPDGRRIATGGTEDEAVTLWDVQSHERLLTLAARVTSLPAIAFSPDGSVLAAQFGAVGATGTLFFWRAPSWAEIEAAERNATKHAQ